MSQSRHLEILVQHLKQHRNKVTVLTGAGISTDSGIPDYRGPNGTYSIQKNYKPITFQQFASSHPFRQRYWARSFLGFPKISLTKPNESHYSLAELEKNGYIGHLITQNVDQLHYRSGQKNLTELHGTLSQVKCLKCRHILQREHFQSILEEMNSDWKILLKKEQERFLMLQTLGVTLKEANIRPDGDIELGSLDYSRFQYPDCPKCGGILKPNVVFFGENLDPEVKVSVFDLIENKTECLMAIATSLEVYSAFRLVKMAHDQKLPVLILNWGQTRAEKSLQHFIKIEAKCLDILPALNKELS